MAKTDWTLMDAVKPDDFNDIGREINQLRTDVDHIEVPAASLTEVGIVQLSNAKDSTSESQAATSKALKDVYDLAQSSLTAGNERKQEVVDALIALGVTASTSDSWDMLVGKMSAIIKATGNATAADVLAGKTFSNDSGNGLVGTLVKGKEYGQGDITRLWSSGTPFVVDLGFKPDWVMCFVPEYSITQGLVLMLSQSVEGWTGIAGTGSLRFSYDAYGAVIITDTGFTVTYNSTTGVHRRMLWLAIKN